MRYFIIIQLIIQQYIIGASMRKEITFEQNSLTHCLINVKNIFGFSINYVEDSIKKYEGKWNRKHRKFQVPISQMPVLAKEFQTIDRSFYIEQVPSIVNQMVNKYSNGSNKVKRQILIDNNMTKRYQYVDEQLVKKILQTNNVNPSKNYQKILIICPQYKVINWLEYMKKYEPRRLNIVSKQIDQCQKLNGIWVCSYQLLWPKVEDLQKYCFQTIIVDDAQIFAKKLSLQQQSALCFRKLLLVRHFVFPIITKAYLNKLQILIPLLSIILPQVNFSWFNKRYKKQNISQLQFIVSRCSLIRNINENKETKSNISSHYFNKLVYNVSQQSIEKMKIINKKNSQLDCKKILQNPQLARNKAQKTYIDSMMQILKSQKMQSICKNIYFLCIQLNLKLVIIIQSNLTYRSIQNYLCEHQISYCHYEHHAQILDFNKNPTIMICLVKNEHLLSINFSEARCTVDELINAKLQNFQPQQYLCLSGVKNIIFPDIDWFANAKRKQQAIHELMRQAHGDIVRHYFILKGTYEEKWMKNLEQLIMKTQMNLKIKQDLMDQFQVSLQNNNQNEDPIFSYNELNLARVQQQYSHLKVIKGVTDIDEQFDQLEFQALQQKIKKQSKKVIMQQKARQKKNQNSQVQSEKSSKIKQSHKIAKKSTKINQSNQCKQNSNQQSHDSDIQAYQILLMKKKPKQNQSQNKAEIYEPVFINSIEDQKNRLQNSIEGNKKYENINKQESKDNSKQLKMDTILNTRQQSIYRNNEEDEKQGQIDNLKQDQTDEVEIIQVRKPPPKPKIVKAKSSTLRVILRPNKIN